MWGRQCPLCDPHTRICPVLWSNRHRSFNSARGNKAFWPNGHLKGDATTNTLISYGYSGIWWRLVHNTELFRYYGATATDLSIQHAETRLSGRTVISRATQPPTH